MVLYKSNANKICQTSHFVLLKHRLKTVFQWKGCDILPWQTKFQQNIGDISLSKMKPLMNVRDGENLPVWYFTIVRRTSLKFCTYKVQRNTAKNQTIEVWQQSRQKPNNKAHVQSNTLTSNFILLTSLKLPSFGRVRKLCEQSVLWAALKMILHGSDKSSSQSTKTTLRVVHSATESFEKSFNSTSTEWIYGKLKIHST